MLDKIKNCLTVSKNKAAVIAVTFCLALTMCPAVFAESPITDATVDAISASINTSVTGLVTSCVGLLAGLIPVGLQILSAWAIFKFGKKFFGQFVSA